MSFYQNQDKARRNTGLLVFYLCLAVFLIVLAINLSVYLILVSAVNYHASLGVWLLSEHSLGLSGILLMIIVGGSLLRLAQLSKGGLAVAAMAGATAVDPETKDPKERQLLNITEEMAIASGTSVPRVFLMRNEPVINAFVAGTTSQNTVLAVTQGALDKLTRDELQGVIGHEYSHILNGDMKLNVRLIGILAGILLIGKIGEFLLRGNRHRSRNREGNQAAILGLALMIIGYLGLFFGRLIKSAISRQREFLADASAVQFTRNPEGIASALYAIEHYDGNGFLVTPNAEDMSHMCFDEAIPMRLKGLLNSHPPIQHRIKAIGPTLLPRLKARFRQRTTTRGEAPTSAIVGTSSGLASSFTNQPTANQILKQSIGLPTTQHFHYAQELHQGLPAQLNLWLHDRNLAEVVLYSLLELAADNQGSVSTKAFIPWLSKEQKMRCEEIFATLQSLPESNRLPVLDIAIATLRSSDQNIRQGIIAHCQQLIRADARIQLNEFIYCYLIHKGLIDAKKPPRNIKSLKKVEGAIALLLSILARHSSKDKPLQQQNFAEVMRYFSKQDYRHCFDQPPSVKQFNHALIQLQRLNPLLKQPVINACIDLVLKDQSASLKEIEILRAACEALDCPMPPLLLDQSGETDR